MFNNSSTSKTHVRYNGNPRGSEWHKWDLHVHTPASVIQHYGDGQQDETWETYISALEALPSEIKVIGLTDYFFLEGYRRVNAARNKGRLPNLDLILPVLELRLASFAGHKELRKINYHVIFSDSLTPEQIELFFLRQLGVEFKLDDGTTWRGDVCHITGLTELGKAIKETTPKLKRPDDSALQIGFRNAAFSLEKVQEAINQTIFEDKIITAVGLAEWDQMRWDRGSAAIKKTIINGADLVLTASPSPMKYLERQEQLRQQEVNSRLLDGSDAHFYADSDQPNRLGHVFSWLKADLTFQGLRRVVQQFDDRVWTGDLSNFPPKREYIQKNRTKYIRSIEIRKKPDSKLDEIWFDNGIPLNTDLIAIIGNQGNGKSALTDIIALCGNSKTDEFSFLNEDKFCDKQNKAREFEAKLTWEDGTQTVRSLDETVHRSDFERVRYVPQKFFEVVTNETVVQEGGQFYGEIKKAVFSHIAKSDQLDCSDIDELIELQTKENRRGLNMLRQELADLNAQIVALEKACAPEEVERLQKEIEVKETEIKTHRSTKPDKVDKPSESAETNAQIQTLRLQENEIQEKIDKAEDTLSHYKKQRQSLNQTQQALENEHRRVEGFVKKIQRDLEEVGLDIKADQSISFQVNIEPIADAIKVINEKIREIERQLDPKTEDSLTRQAQKALKQRKTLESKLERASREYQVYNTKISEWKIKLDSLLGNTHAVGTLRWLEQQLRDIRENRPSELTRLQEERQKKCKEIHKQLTQLAQTFQELTRPVQEHIKSNPLTREKYRLEFTIDLVERDAADRLFSIVSHGIGTFSGVQEGRERLQTIARHYDFGSANDAVAFAEEVLDNLKHNYKNTPPTTVELPSVLKKGHKVEDIYNLLFGLDYLYPQYSLSLNGKPLKQLSPGERGILLLVFYLIVDRGDEPLIIDQPEGNLNNQSIFDNLVPVFKEAKNRRQIIIVTHNPNLAVVCDAEQIIHAQIDFQEGNRVQYQSGALENPIFNKLSLDVLEGTPPAFDARKMTYET